VPQFDENAPTVTVQVPLPQAVVSKPKPAAPAEPQLPEQPPELTGGVGAGQPPVAALPPSGQSKQRSIVFPWFQTPSL
jgi:hypothetical protein